ncbi:MAG: glycosyltransferase family 39 protein, partial [Candidatus Dormibacteraeota bacterium]|nr:glycosyltransferase family 39 protein [Candidatus Dormibacteraeota bacterium]
LLLRIVRTRDARMFLLLGLTLGIGFETKTTILALGAGIAVTVLLSRDLRTLLRTPYPWLGLAIAVACAVPNLLWQAANGWPTLTYIANHRSDIAQSGGVGGFVEQFILVIGPLLLPLWVAGLVLIVRDPRFRPFAALLVVPFVLFLPEGKGYYPAPVVPFVLAAGCVGVGRIVSSTRRHWAVGLVLAAGVLESAIVSPIILPVVPPASMHQLGIDSMNADFANMFGWPEMTAQVAAVYDSLPPQQRRSTAILTRFDGQAGAIDVYGGADHLPQAISPHLNFWYWKPAGLDPNTLVTVGYSPSDLRFLCGSVRRAATVSIPYSIDNLNQGTPILVCTDLREPLSQAWPALKNFS